MRIFQLTPYWRKQIPPNLKQVRKEITKTCLGNKATMCKMMLSTIVGPLSDHNNMVKVQVAASCEPHVRRDKLHNLALMLPGNYPKIRNAHELKNT